MGEEAGGDFGRVGGKSKSAPFGGGESQNSHPFKIERVRRAGTITRVREAVFWVGKDRTGWGGFHCAWVPPLRGPRSKSERRKRRAARVEMTIFCFAIFLSCFCVAVVITLRLICAAVDRVAVVFVLG